MIQLEHISFWYKRRGELFKDVTFKQETGSIVGLFGENGAGKSSLLYLISGLIQPKTGHIHVNGHVPFERTPDFLSDIFLVTDTPFLPTISISAYIKVYAPLYKNFDLEKMHQILPQFKLDMQDKLNSLSSGQQKKFIIAFALATNCKLLLFDEPTNGLDIQSKSMFRKLLVSSIEKDQLFLISTHQVKDIETIIDKIVILDKGQILFEKNVIEVTEKIQFKTAPLLSSVANVLYHEKCPEGFKVILSSEDHKETAVDIELLFNALTNKTTLNF